MILERSTENFVGGYVVGPGLREAAKSKHAQGCPPVHPTPVLESYNRFAADISEQLHGPMRSLRLVVDIRHTHFFMLSKAVVQKNYQSSSASSHYLGRLLDIRVNFYCIDPNTRPNAAVL